MEPREYYRRVLDKIKKCFEHSGCAISIEKELISEGYPKDFPKLITSKKNLDYLTLERGFQIHLPIIGEGCQTVLCPMDFEIFLGEDQEKLYTDKETQKAYFKQTLPIIEYIINIFKERSMPFLLDYTPSGGHLLFHVDVNSRAGKALQSIGSVEKGMMESSLKHGITEKAMLTFSGITRLAEFVALKTVIAFKDNEAEGNLQVNVSDSAEKCINIDNSWCEGAPHTRSIRSPFSLHKKNIEKYKKVGEAPLVDVVGGYFDGRNYFCEASVDTVIDCMWDLEKAAEWSASFTGTIPFANDSMVKCVEEYKNSGLYKYHKDFDITEDIPEGKALEYARNEKSVPDWARDILYNPNPRALQPVNMIGFIHDFVISAKWKPRHVANIMRDLYMDSTFEWVQDFVDSSPADEKANFWVRTFGAIAYWQKGQLKIN